MAGMDALLRFRSAELEAQFWASAPVRAMLLTADRAALAFVLLNNALIAFLWIAIGAEAELRMHFRWTAAFVGAQLLSTWFMHRREGAYYRHRNAIIAIHRVMRIAAAVPYAAIRNTSLQMPLLGNGAGGGMRELIKALAMRGGLPLSWIHALNFPVPFPLQVLYSYMLGLALAIFGVWPGAGILLPGLAARPDLRAAVCRLHRGIQTVMLVPSWFVDRGAKAGGDGDECPPSAPARVVLWVQLVGLLAPLAAVYVIELRAKSAFLSARGVRPPIAARSVALGMAAVLMGVTHVAWLTGGGLV